MPVQRAGQWHNAQAHHKVTTNSQQRVLFACAVQCIITYLLTYQHQAADVTPSTNHEQKLQSGLVLKPADIAQPLSQHSATSYHYRYLLWVPKILHIQYVIQLYA